MNKSHIVLIAVCVLILAAVTILSAVKCAHENEKATVLWPEGKVMKR